MQDEIPQMQVELQVGTPEAIWWCPHKSHMHLGLQAIEPHLAQTIGQATECSVPSFTLLFQASHSLSIQFNITHFAVLSGAGTHEGVRFVHTRLIAQILYAAPSANCWSLSLLTCQRHPFDTTRALCFLGRNVVLHSLSSEHELANYTSENLVGLSVAMGDLPCGCLILQAKARKQ